VKKFAPIFILFGFAILLFGCSTKVDNSFSSGTKTATLNPNTNQQGGAAAMPSAQTLAQKATFVVEYIYENYAEYNFNRYIDFGVENLVAAANSSELEEIERTINILITEIENGTNLSQEGLQGGDGAQKAVQDIDGVLFNIWNREMLSKN